MNCFLSLSISSLPVYIFAEYLPFSGNANCLTILFPFFSVIMETRMVGVATEVCKIVGQCFTAELWSCIAGVLFSIWQCVVIFEIF